MYINYQQGGSADYAVKWLRNTEHEQPFCYAKHYLQVKVHTELCITCKIIKGMEYQKSQELANIKTTQLKMDQLFYHGELHVITGTRTWQETADLTDNKLYEHSGEHDHKMPRDRLIFGALQLSNGHAQTRKQIQNTGCCVTTHVFR